MRPLRKPLLELTAQDLMSEDLVVLTETMSLREAARQLVRNQISGAPVVDAAGRCVGVLSASDFLRLAEKRETATEPAAPAHAITCSFQTKVEAPQGGERILCTLPPGSCAVQIIETEPTGRRSILCASPHAVLTDWQVVQVEDLPPDQVRNFMTRDAVTVSLETGIRTLARMMIDAHIHRLVVVDDQLRPLGIVSSTDLLAALAYADLH
jgi:CBS domain-containing protein